MPQARLRTFSAHVPAGIWNQLRVRFREHKRINSDERRRSLTRSRPTIRLDAVKTMTTREFFHTPGLVKVLNAVRQLTRHPDKRRRLRVPEAKALIHRLETDVRLGYFTHMEADWRDVLRTATEISIAHALELPCPAVDLLHVAYAKELTVDCFLSFDAEQLKLAEATGLNTLRPAAR